VDVQPRHAECLDRVRPGGQLVEVAAADRAAHDAGEDERPGFGLDVHGQVPFGVGHDRGRDADDVAARPRLRRPEHERPGRPLRVRGPYADGARLQVEVGPGERGDFPQRRLANVASRTSARNRWSWVLSARPSPAIFHSARSASARVAYRPWRSA
jgi:hypothetical protein